MLGLFTDKKKDLLIPEPKSFTTQYKLLSNNRFIMGESNLPLEINTETILLVDQIVKEDFIETVITLEYIDGNTSNDILKHHLQTSLALSNITKTIVFRRDKSGKPMYVANNTLLKRDWEKWKTSEIHNIFKDKKEKERFILNYEKGIDNLNYDMISSSVQNSILMPTIYNFKSYQHVSNHYSQKMASKLVGDLLLKYNLYTTHVDINNIGKAKIALKSRLLNSNNISLILKNIYRKPISFSLKDYQWGIYIDYILQQETGKILHSEFSLTEIIHNNLRYDLKIILEEVDNVPDSVMI